MKNKIDEFWDKPFSKDEYDKWFNDIHKKQELERLEEDFFEFDFWEDDDEFKICKLKDDGYFKYPNITKK